MNKPVVLITGASSGIGAALARCWAAKGARIVLLARRRERIDALCDEIVARGGQALAQVGDVTDRDGLDAAVTAVIERFGRIDTVVANAGFGVVGSVSKLEVDDYRRQLETNVFGVLNTIKATLPALRESRGRLALVGSINGYISLPGGTPYAMSKYAVRALAEGLWAELRSAGVSVTHVAPGFIESEIRSVNNRGEFKPGHDDPIPPWLRMPADVAARKIVRAIDRRKREAVITFHGKVAVWLARHAPGVIRLALRATRGGARGEPG